MLTTLEANFVQEYKQTGNASEAVRRAGWKLTNDKSASVIGCRLLKKPKIRELITQADVKQALALTAPTVNYPSRLVSELPTKQQYALKAWQRAGDESTLKEDTKFKYYDLAGKALGHVRNDSERADGDNIQIICKELHLSLNTPPPVLDPPTQVNNTNAEHVIDVEPVNNAESQSVSE